MLPDLVSNPGPLTYESGALPIALRGPASPLVKENENKINKKKNKTSAADGVITKPDCTLKQSTYLQKRMFLKTK